MSTVAQSKQNPILGDQGDVSQVLPEGIGTFKQAKDPVPSGAYFTFKQPQETTPKIGNSEIRIPSNVGYELLKNLDISRLASILAQEAVKIGNIEDPKASDIYRKKLLLALHDLNPKKYPNLTENIVEVTPQEQEVVQQATETSPPKKIFSSPTMFFKEAEKEVSFVTPQNIEVPEVKKERTVYRANISKGKPTLKLITKKSDDEVITTQEQQPEKKPLASLYEEMHSPRPVNTSETTPPETEPRKSPRMEIVTNLLDKRLGYITRAEQLGGPLVTSVRLPQSQTQEAEVPLKIKKSWSEELPEDQKIFLRDITSGQMSLELLISRYAKSYANILNPSSWSNMIAFDAYKIVNDPQAVYGLNDEQRGEISTLIATMQKLILSTHASFTLVPGITIEKLYEETRRVIALADKASQ